MRDAYAEEFDLTEEQKATMTFEDAYSYSDTIISMTFEGIKTKVDFTEEQMQMIDDT